MFEFAPQLLQTLNRTMFGRGRFRSEFVPPRRPRSTSAVHKRPTNDASLAQQVKTAIERTRHHLVSLQEKPGHWEACVYDNVTITAEYVFFLKFLGLLNKETARKCRETILRDQLSNGGWNIFHGGPAEHSATVEAYFALKICGLSKDHAALKKAHKRILAAGGIETTRVFTKINLAFFGQYAWKNVPVIQPELMLLPRKAPIHIYEFSSWSRAVIIPLLIIFHRKPVHTLPRSQQIPELHVPSKRRKANPIGKILKTRRVDLEQIFEMAQKALSLYDLIHVKPLRKKALAMAEKWILDHQDPSGFWGGIFPAIANSITALHLRGYGFEHPVMKKGLAALRSFAEENDEFLRMQSTESPVWDTGIAAYALWESGDRQSDWNVSNCIDWLLKEQITDVSGDWRHKAKGIRPGGWPFEFENAHFPDIDDTALAILALLPAERAPFAKKAITDSVNRGVEWLIGMQSSDGGWGAFDKDNNRQILNQIPFADLKSLLDPSSPDVTGHVIEALGAAGYHRASSPIEKAVKYLQSSQEENGSWFGRWGVNYVYGTGAALSGLAVAGEDMTQAYIRKARNWLIQVQNTDGGWGECCTSYDKGTYVPLGRSTASQTAWALIGLLACPGTSEQVIAKGIRYLLKHQQEDGSWNEPEWTGTGFPRHFYLRYDYYRIYFPLLALGRFAKRASRPFRSQSSATA